MYTLEEHSTVELHPPAPFWRFIWCYSVVAPSSIIIVAAPSIV